jgi:hypothetical protein
MNKYKRLIEDYEERHSGIGYVNGGYAKAINIRVGKHKITADIKLVKQFEGITERFNDCEYSKELFKEGGFK